MKKIILVTIFVLVSVAVFAQRGIPRSDDISIGVTINTINTKETKFQQMVNFHVALPLDAFAGASYIAGYKFKHWLLGGLGVGFYGDLAGSVTQFYIPAYAHLRCYFSQTKWKPYASLSLGAFFGSGDDDTAYSDQGAYLDCSFGVERRINDIFSCNFALGCNNIANMFAPEFKIGLSF